MTVLSGELATWVTDLRLSDVPPAVVDAACRHLLDGVGVAVAAGRRDAASACVDVARSLAGPPEASILGSRNRLSAPAAALATGALVHALDFDDTHAGGLVHATAVVLPSCLVVGQQVGVDGSSAVEAAVAGYEIVCRLGLGAPQRFHARGAHPTSVCGVYAATAVAGKMLGLPAERLAHAFGVAGSLSSGVMEFLHGGGDVKQLHTGWASAAGILAARFAAAGLTGPPQVLEGTFGTYRVFADQPVDPAAVLDGLGDRWESTRITVKPYPACQLLHASVDAARELRTRVPPSDLQEVTAVVPPESVPIVCEPAEGKVTPPSPYAAKFSLPYAVASMLVDGFVGIDTFSPAAIRRPDVEELARRVRYRTAAVEGPAADAPGVLEARTTAANRVRAEVPRSSGGPDDPRTPAMLRAKALQNLGEGRDADDLVAWMMDLGGQQSLDPILEAAARLVRRGAPIDADEARAGGHG